MPAFPIIIVLLLYISLGTYVFIRGWQALPKKRMLCISYLAVFIFASLCFITGITLARTLPMSFSIFCKSIGGCWAVSLTLFATAALLADLLRILKRFVPTVKTCLTHHGRQIRKVYLTIVFLAASMLVVNGYIRFIHPRTVTLNLDVDKPATPQRKLTIVAASDLHLGGVGGLKRLDSWVNLINRQQPDIIVFAGDLMDRDFEYPYAGGYIKKLKKLKARFGVYSILGNHEYYNDPQKAITLMESSGIRVLRDQSVTLDSSLVIIGRDDGTYTPRRPLDSLMNGLNRDLLVILLDHQPIFDVTPEYRIDLQISGHLHNGQLFPYNLIVKRLWLLSYGYKKCGDTHFYVTSGLGIRFIPIRLGTQSEIVKFQLNTEHKQLRNKDLNN